MQLKNLRFEWKPAAQSSRKLMIVLHGRGDSPEGFRWLPSALGIPDVNYLLLEAPDEYYGGFSWYDLPPNQGPGILRSRILLDQALAEIKTQGFRTEDILLFGFSQGCLMTLEWGARQTDVFRGFIGISGYCFDPETLSKEMTPSALKAPWLVTHGIFDGVLDFSVTEDQVRYLQQRGLPIEFHSYRKAHTIDELMELPKLIEWIKELFKETSEL